MRKSTRLLLVLGVIDLALAVFGLWLVAGLRNGAFHAATSPAEAAATVYQVVGGVIGLLGVIGVIAALALRRNGQ